MKCCAALPGGGAIYRHVQKAFGRLRVKPMSRLPAQAEMGRLMQMAGHEILGNSFLEVGTGHVPLAPIGWFLCGAANVFTMDLHRRIDLGLTQKSLAWISGHKDEVLSSLRVAVSKEVFDDRFLLLSECQHNPEMFFQRAGIEYLAPHDAANTELPDESIGCHFSITVLEHISKEIIKSILSEAKRILREDGVAIHFVDLSDHFQHQDHSISKINFLRFSESEWNCIAGNEFAYCNRLRASQYKQLFEGLGFRLGHLEYEQCSESLEQLTKNSSFIVDPFFSSFTAEDLTIVRLRFLLEK